MDDVVIFANTKLQIRSNSQLAAGQIVVNDPAGVATLRGMVQTLGPQLPDIPTGTQVVANTINAIGTKYLKAQLYDVFTNAMNAPKGVTISGTQAPVTLPLFTFPTAPVVTPGTDQCPTPGRIKGDCIVHQSDGPITLAPGSYRQIDVRAYAQLYFTGGTYNIKSLRAGFRSALLFNGTTTINVAQRVFVGLTAVFGPSNVNEMTGRCVTVNVAGNDVHFRPYSDVAATVIAPNAAFFLGSDSNYRGSFTGKTVDVGFNVNLKTEPTVPACP